MIIIIPITFDEFSTNREDVGHEIEDKLELFVMFDGAINDATILVIFGGPTLIVVLEIERTSKLLVSVVN